MEIIFKKCEASDIEKLRNISISTFTKAFEEQNDPNDFQVYLAKAFSPTQLSAELDDPNSTFYFVLQAEILIGYCKVNVLMAQGEFREPEGMELERIYVKSEFQGKGIGAKILSFVESVALNEGKAYLWLGVWEANVNAIRFYEKQGYSKIGTHPYYIGNDEQTDWLFKKELI